MIKKSDIQKWCEALRSGKYAQDTKRLETTDGLCCLGVACKIFISKTNQDINCGRLTGTTPINQPNSPQWLKDIDRNMGIETGKHLTDLNDINKLSFDEIADCLEAVYIHEVLS